MKNKSKFYIVLFAVLAVILLSVAIILYNADRAIHSEGIETAPPTSVPAPDTPEDIQTAEQNVNELIFDNPHGLPETPHGGSLLHVWNMSFNEITNHLPYIAEAGFNTIQTSPVGRSITSGSMARRWYSLYQPTYFEIGNWLGSEEEFRAMTAAAARHGIYVIVDAIPNHTTGDWRQIDTALTDHDPPIFHHLVFPEYNKQITQWENRRDFVRARLLNLFDYYTGSPYFQELYMDFLGSIIDAGASGFRYDAAHHIELPCDSIMFDDLASDFWPNTVEFVDQRILSHGRIPFQYGEILGNGCRQNQYIQALPGFLASSYAYSGHITGTIRSGRLKEGESGWNSNDFLITGSPDGRTDLDNLRGDATRVVPWVECHDHYGNDGVSRDLTDAQIAVGWALINTRADTSPLFFVRPGPGFENSGNMFIGDVGTTATNAWGHSLFYRDPVISAINWFSNDFHGQPELTSTHGNVAMIQRGSIGNYTGIALVNVSDEAIDVAFPVHIADGSYSCRISGEIFTVDSGWIFGPAIGAQTVIIIQDRIDHPDFEDLVVSAYPGTTNHGDMSAVFTDTHGVDVTLLSLNSEVARYTVSRNGIRLVEFTDFKNDTLINIGANADVGDIFTVTVAGMNETDAIVQTFFYVRGDSEAVPEQIRLEFEGPATWTNAGIWSWPVNVANGSWPGTDNRFTWDDAADAWVFILPQGFDLGGQTFTINNGLGNVQTPDISGVHQNSRITWTGTGSPVVSPIEAMIPPLPPAVIQAITEDTANAFKR